MTIIKFINSGQIFRNIFSYIEIKMSKFIAENFDIRYFILKVLFLVLVCVTINNILFFLHFPSKLFKVSFFFISLLTYESYKYIVYYQIAKYIDIHTNMILYELIFMLVMFCLNAFYHINTNYFQSYIGNYGNKKSDFAFENFSWKIYK